MWIQTKYYKGKALSCITQGMVCLCRSRSSCPWSWPDLCFHSRFRGPAIAIHIRGNSLYCPLSSEGHHVLGRHLHKSLLFHLSHPPVSLVIQSLSHFPVLCDPVDCSRPGFPVLHYLPEFAQTHVHWVDDAIQPSHPLLPSSCPQCVPASGSFSMSQLFASVGQSTGASASASVLLINI